MRKNPKNPRNERPEGPAPDRRVLVVGGEPALVRSVRATLRGRGCPVETALDAEAARARLAADATPTVLLVVETAEGLDPAAELLIGEFAGEVRAIVLGRDATASRVVAAMRCGAIDFLEWPVRPAELRARVTEVLGSDPERIACRSERVRRLEALCRRLTRARSEAGEREASLARELDRTRETFAGRQADATAAGELRGLLAGELDLEQLIRTGVEHLMARIGASNAAVFLPTDAGWKLGAYVRLDLPRVLVQPALERLAAEACAEVAGQEHLLRFDDTAEFAESVGGDAGEAIARCTMIAWPCVHEGECRAVFFVFRDAERPFADSVAATADALRRVFAESIARLLRIHHRCRPAWPADLDGERDAA